ncbi:hypothetical protein AVEN_60886-1 [Araneus ventricosus]|uniref:Uncharacterized protein n=1 Tax=Araneus ventricosus TaxID=182803 RepID=A0A4Y2VS68_ARAVE|nr:hypothetical protein AVEN_60886-1 [Araneus ventricosus]
MMKPISHRGFSLFLSKVWFSSIYESIISNSASMLVDDAPVSTQEGNGITLTDASEFNSESMPVDNLSTQSTEDEICR